jgi:hypothetical protein
MENTTPRGFVKPGVRARHLNPRLGPPWLATLLKRGILAAYAWRLLSARVTCSLIHRFALWSA